MQQPALLAWLLESTHNYYIHTSVVYVSALSMFLTVSFVYNCCMYICAFLMLILLLVGSRLTMESVLHTYPHIKVPQLYSCVVEANPLSHMQMKDSEGSPRVSPELLGVRRPPSRPGSALGGNRSGGLPGSPMLVSGRDTSLLLLRQSVWTTD